MQIKFAFGLQAPSEWENYYRDKFGKEEPLQGNLIIQA